MTIRINSAAFTQQLRRYAKVNRRSFKEIVNAKALDMAFQALKHTDAANASAIEYKLGAIGNKVSKSPLKTQTKTDSPTKQRNQPPTQQIQRTLTPMVMGCRMVKKMPTAMAE